MRDFIEVMKALSDPNRVRALMALTDGELCVCQIIELLELAPSTVSKHMSILRNARLVESRKSGRWINYRLAEKEVNEYAKRAISSAIVSLSDNEIVQNDKEKLKTIRRLDIKKNRVKTEEENRGV